jgi:hypothetical protein
MPTWRRVTLALLAVVIAGGSTTLAAGFTHVAQVQSDIGAWSPDGAKADTFWDTGMVDVPGLSLYAVHCHGYVRYDLQAGATGPQHHNPCDAAMIPPGSDMIQSAVYEAYFTFPLGNKTVYRCTVKDGPWIYFIGDPIYDSASSAQIGLEIPPCPPS